MGRADDESAVLEIKVESHLAQDRRRRFEVDLAGARDFNVAAGDGAHDAPGRRFDVTADGKKFLVIERMPEPEGLPFTVLLNWKSVMEK